MIRKIRKAFRFSVMDYRLPPRTEHRKPNNELAFTLIELLITVTIFSAVAIVIYGTFNSGMRIWRRAENLNLSEIKNLMKIEKMSRELRQTYVFKGKDIAFTGDKNKIQFPAMLDSEICNVIYSFDPDKKIFLRGAQKLADIISMAKDKKEADPNLTPYINEINEFKFSYFYFDIKKGTYAWKEEWKENTLPFAVKFNIIIENEPFTTTVLIPSA